MDNPGTLLKLVADHERALQFDTFSASLAWEIGSLLRSDALARTASMTFEIQLAGRTLFACATDGAPAGQADWIRRKRNTVMRFSRSSFAIGLQLDLEDKTLEARHGLSLVDYAAHGGGFPIVLKGTGCVGSIVASGLTQRVDHEMVVTAIASALGIPVPPLGA
ncbi:MAG: heme-degrading domain-containing protein [Acidobacteriaceae bacterium]